MPFWLEIIVNLVFAWLASVGFGLIINVPHRALVLCSVSGSAGWILYWLANRIGIGRLGSNLLGALCVGILGLVFARIKKCPVTVFNIPGVVPLVPGVPAYQAVRAMVEGQLSDAEDLILRVAIVTIAIAIRGKREMRSLTEIIWTLEVKAREVLMMGYFGCETKTLTYFCMFLAKKTNFLLKVSLF